MAAFITDLWQSIFTPGPTPSIIIATNVSFAALQVVLLALLVATYSVHFLILSFLSAGLWWAINWFVTELEAANKKEAEAQRLREVRRAREGDRQEADSGTETEMDVTDEGGKSASMDLSSSKSPEGGGQSQLRKRKSVGEKSDGDLSQSTDSEWDKIEGTSDLGDKAI